MQIQELFQLGTSLFTYGLLVFMISALLLMVISSIMKKYLIKYVNSVRDKKIKQGGREALSANTTFSFITSVIKVSISVLVVLLIIMQIKPLASIGTAALGATGIVAVMVGLAAQESASTLIGGVFLSFYKPFIQGDLIYIPEKNITGRVIEISLRHTTIQTFNNSTVIIPNNIMNSAIIENKEEDGKYYNFITFGVAYGSNYDLAKEIVLKSAKEHPSAMEENLQVVISELNNSSVDVRLGVYTKDVPTGVALKFDLNEVVLKEFEKNNITIPFNTQTIHVVHEK